MKRLWAILAIGAAPVHHCSSFYRPWLRHVVAAKAEETELTRDAVLKLNIDLAFICNMRRSSVGRHDRFLEIFGRLRVAEEAKG